jgi:hypothetical protein
LRILNEGDRVQARNYVGHDLWKYGTVRPIKRSSKLHYLIFLDNKLEIKRHINQLKKTDVGIKTSQHHTPRLYRKYNKIKQRTSSIIQENASIPTSPSNPTICSNLTPLSEDSSSFQEYHFLTNTPDEGRASNETFAPSSSPMGTLAPYSSPMGVTLALRRSARVKKTSSVQLLQ